MLLKTSVPISTLTPGARPVEKLSIPRKPVTEIRDKFIFLSNQLLLRSEINFFELRRQLVDIELLVGKPCGSLGKFVV